MCGRLYLKTNLEGLLRAFSFAKREGVEGLANQLPRFNGAPSQYYPIIIQDVIRDDGCSPAYGRPGGIQPRMKISAPSVSLPANRMQ